MTETTNENGTEKGGRERAEHRATFPTLQEAREIKPPSDKFRIYKVTGPNGQQVYTWARGVWSALTNAAQQDGYKAKVAEAKGKVSVEDAVLSMSDEEFQALLARRAGQSGIQEATTKSKGKGKK